MADTLALAPVIPSLETIGTRLNGPIPEGSPDLIPGLLPQQGQLVLAGPTDIGKSLVALEICSSLVTGVPLWGQLTPSGPTKRILYLLGEHYNAVLQRLWRITGLPITDDVWLVGPEQLHPERPLVVYGRQRKPAIDRLTKWAEGADLIIFDPLTAFIVGIDAENDNIQMRLLLDTMTQIAQTVGASCLILAHHGKPLIDRTGQEHSRQSYAIRGASAIEDASTNIFYMSQTEPGSSRAAQGQMDATNLFTLFRRKYKGDAPNQYHLIRDTTTKRHTMLGNRPFVDARRTAVAAKVASAQAALPDLTLTEIVTIVAAIEQLTTRTIWNYLGRTDHE
jgi:RecA-family ATPase